MPGRRLADLGCLGTSCWHVKGSPWEPMGPRPRNVPETPRPGDGCICSQRPRWLFFGDQARSSGCLSDHRRGRRAPPDLRTARVMGPQHSQAAVPRPQDQAVTSLSGPLKGDARPARPSGWACSSLASAGKRTHRGTGGTRTRETLWGQGKMAPLASHAERPRGDPRPQPQASTMERTGPCGPRLARATAVSTLTQASRPRAALPCQASGPPQPAGHSHPVASRGQ